MSEREFNDDDLNNDDLDSDLDNDGFSDFEDDLDQGESLDDEFAEDDFSGDGLLDEDDDLDPGDELDLSVDDELEQEIDEIDSPAPAENSSGAGAPSAPAGGGFLSTMAGKVAAGAGAFVLLMLVSAGYLMFAGGSSKPAPRQVAQSPNWGEPASVPANEASLPSAPSADPAPQGDIDAPASNPEPVSRTPVGESALGTPRKSAVSDVIAQMNNPSATQTTETRTPVTSFEREPSVQTPVVQAEPSIDVDRLKSDIISAIRAELPKSQPAPSAVDSEVVRALRTLQQEVSSLRGEIDSIEVKAADVAKKQEGLREGRSRLKGFNVINVTDDGTMSVVKTPSNAVNVYFKGETFNLDGRKVTVTDIAEDGRLVLVGDDYFIDEVREPRPAPKTIARQSEPVKAAKPASTRTTRAVTRVYDDEEPAQSERVVSFADPVSVVTRNGNVVISPKPAPGWSLNASMSQGFLVKNPRGEFRLVQRGDMIEGLGVVDGLDNEGSLRVGIYKIPRE